MNKQRPPCAHAPRHESAGSAQFQVPAVLIAGKHETSSMALAETQCRSESVGEINNPRPFQGSKYAGALTKNSATHISLHHLQSILCFRGLNEPELQRAKLNKHIYTVLKRLATPSDFHIPLPSVVPFAHS
jgi:hypothetical protein